MMTAKLNLFATETYSIVTRAHNLDRQLSTPTLLLLCRILTSF